MPQKTVVKPLAVADAVSAQIEGHTRHDNQVSLIGVVIDARGARLQNAETPLFEACQPSTWRNTMCSPHTAG